MKEEYPEELTEEEANNYKDMKIFDGERTFKEDYLEAVKFANKNKGEVYTMIDGDDNKTYYWKGLHYVNRFSICVLKK